MTHVHEFDPVTFKCLVRGCKAQRDEPGQVYMGGVKSESVSQGIMFGNVRPDPDESTPRPRPEDPDQGKLF